MGDGWDDVQVFTANALLLHELQMRAPTHARSHAHIHTTGPPENVQRMLRIHAQMGFWFISAVNVLLKSKGKIRLIWKKNTPVCC